MIIPLGLTDEQEHIYTRMYKRCNFDSMEVRYTVKQLVDDSNKCFNLTTQKVRTILKFLIKNNYILEISKGSKGNPTTYKIAKIQQLNNNNLTINQQQSNNQNIVTKPFTDVEQQQSNNNLTTNQQLINNPINEKEKEKEKDILSLKKELVSRAEIIDYLNDKTGKHYKPNTSKTKTVIEARIKEGFTLEDFKTVIDNKTKQWLGGSYDKYLRPETLFGSKFEGYLNESKTTTNKYEPNNQQVKRYTFDENPF